MLHCDSLIAWFLQLQGLGRKLPALFRRTAMRTVFFFKAAVWGQGLLLKQGDAAMCHCFQGWEGIYSSQGDCGLCWCLKAVKFLLQRPHLAWRLDTRAHCRHTRAPEGAAVAVFSMWGGFWCGGVTSCEQQISRECVMI